MMNKAARIMVAFLLGLGLASGCASKQPVTAKTPIQDLKAPEWVVKGSGAFGGERGKAFYGVGSAVNMQSSLLRTAADNRARNEVAKVFQVYSSSLMKDYSASTSAGQANVTSEEQNVEQAVKTVTAMTISGVEIVDHWQNSATGEMYSLARLDLAAFKDNLEKAKELDAKAKEYIRQNADRLHGQLAEEEGKLKVGK
jgi:hypothetical protein